MEKTICRQAAAARYGRSGPRIFWAGPAPTGGVCGGGGGPKQEAVGRPWPGIRPDERPAEVLGLVPFAPHGDGHLRLSAALSRALNLDERLSTAR